VRWDCNIIIDYRDDKRRGCNNIHRGTLLLLVLPSTLEAKYKTKRLAKVKETTLEDRAQKHFSSQ
jgi:hypothetical protein